MFARSERNVLTKTALPRLSDFFPLIQRTMPEPFASHSTWFTMNGRNAIYYALNLLSINKGDVVLLPSFHCTAMVDPVIAYGAQVKYYTVNRDLSLNLQEIELHVKNGAAVVLCVHFFGFPAPVEELLRICSAYGIRLIEDCTHGLFGRIGNKHMGTFGHAAIFSFRKTLPVQDGAALLLTRKQEITDMPKLKAPAIYHLRMAKWTYEKLLLANNNEGHANRQVIESSITSSTTIDGIDYHKGPDSQENPTFVTQWLNWPMSVPSKWILRRSKPELLLQRRRSNYEQLHKHLKKINKLHPCYPKLRKGVCPLGYPFIFEYRRRVDRSLRRLGIAAFSFGEILHPSLPQKRFPDALYLSKNLTILPIHQGLSENDIDHTGNVVAEFLGSKS